jgi:CheY-like chemotaxis protein
VQPVKLLVVENDPASLKLMTDVFTSLKAEVRSLSDSREAAMLVEREKFDGIFLGLEMPELDGLQLAKKARKSSWNKSTPVVIVTGREKQGDMRQSFATGATFFLQTPMDRQRLIRLFRSVYGAVLENRRRCLRVPLQVQVSCIVGSRTLNGRSWNISQGGMKVEVDDLRANDAVRVSLKLPKSGLMIDALGLVVWVKDGRQGIQFTKVAPKIQDQIKKFTEEIEFSLKQTM